ncbi:MAG: hypothetical protein ABII00_08335 [Elusimicrobiota bacterium]
MRVRIDVPADLNDRQRKLLEEFAGTLDEPGQSDGGGAKDTASSQTKEGGGIFKRIFGGE